jgi:hypothetical protein
VFDLRRAAACGMPLLLTLVSLTSFASLSRAAALPPAPVFGYAPEYVIVTNASLAGEFARLAHWKNRVGIPALVETIEDIRASYPSGVDDAERVRLFLRDAHQTWNTRWVLIGGDATVIPAREAHSTFIYATEVPTDLYYACLDGSWNADGDALWGEGYVSSADPGDDADLVPELYLGRAPVRTPEEARRFVDKTLRWGFLPLEPRAYQVLDAAEVLFPQDWSPGAPPPTLDGAELSEQVLPMLLDNPDIHVCRLYENWDDSRWPGALPLDRARLLDSLNAGYDFVLHVGAGSATQLSAGPDLVSTADLSALVNAGRLSNVYTFASSTGSLDRDGIGGAFLGAPDGGAVTFIGPTQLSFVNAGRSVTQEFLRLVYDADVSTIGEAFARQMQPFLAFTASDGVFRLTVMELALLGDPELRLYERPGTPLSVAHPEAIAVGVAGFSVTVGASGAPVAGARVAASIEGAQLALATTDSRGVAEVPFTALAPGEVDVTVTAPDGRRWSGSLPAAAALAVGDAKGGEFRMLPPAPIPARTTLRLAFELPAGMDADALKLAVFDATGRRVRELAMIGEGAGRSTASWDLRSSAGARVPDGIYFVRAFGPGVNAARRVLVLR